MQAYVLVGVKPNREEHVFNKMQKLEEVKEIHLLFGSWDIIARVEIKDIADLNKFMLEKVRRMGDVTLTATMIIAK